MIPRFYIYRHLRNDTGEVFYVGKGANRPSRRPIYERAFTKLRKNKWWQNVVQKHGYTVEIMCHCKTDEEASEREKFFIKLYGRKEHGGSLVNQTDGGDGRPRGYFSAEEREKRGFAARGRKYPAWVGQKISAAKKGVATSIQKGDTLPDWWKDRIRQTKLGKRNPMFGRTAEKHPNSKRVINTATGEVFPSVTVAAERAGMPMKSLYNMLSGFRKNRTQLQFQ